MLLHIDGSKHQWFQDERYYDLIVILDDATSEIYYAQLVEERTDSRATDTRSRNRVFPQQFRVGPPDVVRVDFGRVSRQSL